MKSLIGFDYINSDFRSVLYHQKNCYDFANINNSDFFEFCIIKRIVMTPQLNIDNCLRATKHIILQARRYLLRKNEEHCKIALFANKKCPKLLNMLAPEVVKCQGTVET